MIDFAMARQFLEKPEDLVIWISYGGLLVIGCRVTLFLEMGGVAGGLDGVPWCYLPTGPGVALMDCVKGGSWEIIGNVLQRLISRG